MTNRDPMYTAAAEAGYVSAKDYVAGTKATQTPAEREPGWYWVRIFEDEGVPEKHWRPLYYRKTSKKLHWRDLETYRGFDEIAEIGPRILPPDPHGDMLAAAEADKEKSDLISALEYLIESVEEPPQANCSCHFSPPCGDCVDYGGLREALQLSRAALRQAKGA